MHCEEIKKIVSNFSLIRECDTILNGMLRLSTPFQNIEGSFIDLYIGEQNDLYSPYILTDLGGTSAYLFDMNIKLYATKKRKRIMHDICVSLGVIEDNGEFKIPIGKEELKELPEAIVRLSQACIRIKEKIRNVKKLYEQAKHKAESGNFAYQLAKLSLESHLEELLQIEKNNRKMI